MANQLPRASLIEGVRFTAQVLVPNVVQGLFRRRRRAVAVAAKANVDGHAIGLLSGLRRSHGESPIWVRAARDQALLVHSEPDLRRVLEGSPHPFAADPEAKRKGMGCFQPDALTLSRGELWAERRRFTEAVLDTGKPVHRCADRFAAAAREEAESLLGEVAVHAGELDWDRFYGAFRRLTRRIVLGDAARDDEEISDLLTAMMDEANGMPGEPSERLGEFTTRLRSYIDAGEEGSLVSLFGEAPQGPETKPEGQLAHWLMAFHETMTANAFRALALIANHPQQAAAVGEEIAGAGELDASAISSLAYLEACIEEALRLWPTTPLLSRETLEDVEWNGETVPAGTQVLISNLFNHRDRDRHDFADRFAPEAWIEGRAADDWTFNHFSHGPQGCPGAGLALFAAKGLLAAILSRGPVELSSPRLDPEKPLPQMLDFFSLKFALERPS